MNFWNKKKNFYIKSGQAASRLKIRAGSTTHAGNGTLYDVVRIIQHPDFTFLTIDYDFSLLELATNITFDSTKQPIKLPRQNKQYADDTPALVTGWGNTQNVDESRDRLRAAIVPIVNQEDCSNAYSAFGGVTDRMICAGLLVEGGKDACQGDSGGMFNYRERHKCILKNRFLFPSSFTGPLVTDGTLIG